MSKRIYPKEEYGIVVNKADGTKEDCTYTIINGLHRYKEMLEFTYEYDPTFNDLNMGCKICRNIKLPYQKFNEIDDGYIIQLNQQFKNRHLIIHSFTVSYSYSIENYDKLCDESKLMVDKGFDHGHGGIHMNFRFGSEK